MVARKRAGMTRADVAKAPVDTAPANTGSHLSRGAAARAASKQAAEDNKNESHEPWRFWMRNDTNVDPKTVSDDMPTGMPNNECDIIILDESLDDIVGQHEHNLKIGGKYGNFEACPKEWDLCPLCENDKAYYIVFMSVLVLRPWVSADGKKSGNCTRMLLPVKSSQLAKFEELCQASQKHNGKLRGTYFYMRRDVTSSQSSSIGEPTVLESGMMFDFWSEEEMVTEFGHAAITSPEGKVLKAENEDLQPFDYEEVFKKPDAAKLRKRYGGAAPAGSSESADEDWGTEAQQAPTTQAAPRKRRTALATTATEPDEVLPPADGATQGADPFSVEE